MIRTLLLFLLSILFGGIIFVYVGNTLADFILSSFKIFLNLEGFLIIILSFLLLFRSIEMEK